MFKSFSLKNSIVEMADQVTKAGYVVEASYGEATVSIRNRAAGIEINLDEEGAVDFIENAENLASDARVDLDTAMLAEAKQYTDVQ